MHTCISSIFPINCSVDIQFITCKYDQILQFVRHLTSSSLSVLLCYCTLIWLISYICIGGRELDNKHQLRFITLYLDPHPTCGLLPVGFIIMVVGPPTIT